MAPKTYHKKLNMFPSSKGNGKAAPKHLQEFKSLEMLPPQESDEIKAIQEQVGVGVMLAASR